MFITHKYRRWHDACYGYTASVISGESWDTAKQIIPELPSGINYAWYPEFRCLAHYATFRFRKGPPSEGQVEFARWMTQQPNFDPNVRDRSMWRTPYEWAELNKLPEIAEVFRPPSSKREWYPFP